MPHKNPEDRRLYLAKWREKNRKRISESQKCYQQSEKGKKYYADWNKRNYWKDPEYYRIKRFSRKYGTDIGILKIVRLRDKVCQMCGDTDSLQFDHIYPVSLGGKGTEDNLQLLCKECNLFKRDNLLLPEGGMLLWSVT